MKKNDFRVQMPLWTIALYVIMAIWGYGLFYIIYSSQNGFVEKNLEGGQRFIDQLDLVALSAMALGTLMFILFFVYYFIRLEKHNRENPNNKLTLFYLTKPDEFLEDDEMTQQITGNATKKVYVFYAQALPLLIVLMFFPIHRYFYVLAVILLLIIQQALYYWEIRKYIVD